MQYGCTLNLLLAEVIIAPYVFIVTKRDDFARFSRRLVDSALAPVPFHSIKY